MWLVGSATCSSSSVTGPLPVTIEAAYTPMKATTAGQHGKITLLG